MVLKPAEDTPLTAVLPGAVTEAGVPAGVVNVVTTEKPGDDRRDRAGRRRVRKLSFTGSTGVGSLLLKQAADRDRRLLDGARREQRRSSVLDDADLDAAVEGAMLAKMRNGGQACTAANRFLVRSRSREEFAAEAGRADGRAAVGPGTDEPPSSGR